MKNEKKTTRYEGMQIISNIIAEALRKQAKEVVYTHRLLNVKMHGRTYHITIETEG